MRGELAFDSDLSVSSARGQFSADPASVTMGDPDLDHTLHGATLVCFWYLRQHMPPHFRCHLLVVLIQLEMSFL